MPGLTGEVANLIVALKLDDSGFSGKLNRLSRQVSGMDRGLSQMSRGAGQVASGIARLGTVAATAAAGGLAAVVTTAASYEQAFTGVQKTVDATDAQFRVLDDTIKRMAGTTGTSFEELAAIGEAGGALGVEIDQLEQFIDVVNRLSVSTPLSADAAATALGQLRNVLHLNNDEMESLADSLVALGNAGASTEDQIIDIAARFAAAAQSAGLTNDVTLALASTVASMGIEAEAGGSSLSRLFNSVATNIGTANDKALAFADGLGLSLEQFRDAWDQDASKVFEDLLDHLNTLDQFEAAAFLKAIGVTNTRDVNTLRLLAQGVDEYGRQVEVARDSQGALREESDKFFGTTARGWERVKQNVRNAADTIGDQLLPIVNEQMEEFIGWLNQADTQKGLRDFAKNLAGGVRDLVTEVRNADFSTLIESMKGAAGIAKGAFDAFNALPPEVKQLALAALVANKVTGGAVGGIAQGLGNLLGGALKLAIPALSRGVTPANPLFVKEVGIGGGPAGGPLGGGRGGRGGPFSLANLLKLALPFIAFGIGRELAGGSALPGTPKAFRGPAGVNPPAQPVIGRGAAGYGGPLPVVNPDGSDIPTKILQSTAVTDTEQLNELIRIRNIDGQTYSVSSDQRNELRIARAHQASIDRKAQTLPDTAMMTTALGPLAKLPDIASTTQQSRELARIQNLYASRTASASEATSRKNFSPTINVNNTFAPTVQVSTSVIAQQIYRQTVTQSGGNQDFNIIPI